MIKMTYSEKGQAIVLLVLAISGLLALTALALDGAMVYSDRRTAQNAADAASAAGSGAAGASLRYRSIDREAWTCSNDGSAAYGYIVEAQTKAVSSATDRANSNDYVDGAGDTQVTVTTLCSNGADFAEKYLDVEVEITTPTRPSLIHIVYKGSIANTVTAVSRVRPGYESGLFEGSAIVALKPEDKDVFVVSGSKKNSYFHVHGGGVFVNSNHDKRAFWQHGNGGITVDAPGAINVVGGATYDEDDVHGTVDPGAPAIPYPDGVPVIPAPTCASAAVVSGNRMSPGYWSGVKFPPNGVTELGDPGSDDTKIYCIQSGEFEMNSGELTGHNVMIYLADGGLAWNGGELHLDAPDEGMYAGLLVYVDPKDYENIGDTGNEKVTINGNSDSDIEGTIFAPTSWCKINGTSDSDAYRSQTICYVVDLNGSGVFNITYDPDDSAKEVKSPKMEVKD